MDTTQISYARIDFPIMKQKIIDPIFGVNAIEYLLVNWCIINSNVCLEHIKYNKELNEITFDSEVNEEIWCFSLKIPSETTSLFVLTSINAEPSNDMLKLIDDINQFIFNLNHMELFDFIKLFNDYNYVSNYDVQNSTLTILLNDINDKIIDCIYSDNEDDETSIPINNNEINEIYEIDELNEIYHYTDINEYDNDKYKIIKIEQHKYNYALTIFNITKDKSISILLNYNSSIGKITNIFVDVILPNNLSYIIQCLIYSQYNLILLETIADDLWDVLNDKLEIWPEHNTNSEQIELQKLFDDLSIISKIKPYNLKKQIQEKDFCMNKLFSIKKTIIIVLQQINKKITNNINNYFSIINMSCIFELIKKIFDNTELIILNNNSELFQELLTLCTILMNDDCFVHTKNMFEHFNIFDTFNKWAKIITTFNFFAPKYSLMISPIENEFINKLYDFANLTNKINIENIDTDCLLFVNKFNTGLYVPNNEYKSFKTNLPVDILLREICSTIPYLINNMTLICTHDLTELKLGVKFMSFNPNLTNINVFGFFEFHFELNKNNKYVCNFNTTDGGRLNYNSNIPKNGNLPLMSNLIQYINYINNMITYVSNLAITNTDMAKEIIKVSIIDYLMQKIKQDFGNIVAHFYNSHQILMTKLIDIDIQIFNEHIKTKYASFN